MTTERVYTEHMTTTHSTQIEGPKLSPCPADGGKWELLHIHFDADNNEFGVSILQDTNKARLAKWKKEPLMWCCLCQEENEGM
jgi:hypothetical protein